MRVHRILSCAVALPIFLALTVTSRANASGLYFSERGVRPLGRGGAFVAGADDLGAIWYNPAGIADAGSTFFVDASWLNYSSEFSRKALVFDGNDPTSAGHLYQYPTVTGSTPFLPIPTMAGSYQFGTDKAFTIALGIMSPYTAITSYPLTVNGAPAASRYSLISLDGSALVLSGAYLSYKPIERLRIGGGVQALVGTFQSSVVFSASPPDRLISAPEDPAYDTTSQLKVGPIFSPSANFGIIGIPIDQIHVGASVQLPQYIDAPAQVSVRFPSAAPFDHASQQGNQGTVHFTLPAILRAGVEYRTPIGGDKEIRVEAAYVREFWSMHQSIDLRATNIQLNGITGFPSPISVAPITLPRNFQDSNSVRLGGELRFPAGSLPLAARLGFNFDQSAIPTNYVSPLTIDSDKYTVALGGSIWLVDKKMRLDIVYAHVFAADVTVDPATAAISRVNPVAGNAVKYPEAINGGTYTQHADIIGLGLEYRFAFGPDAPKEPAKTAPPPTDLDKKPDDKVSTPGADSDEPIIDPVIPPPGSEPPAAVEPPPTTDTTPAKPPKKPPKKPKKKPPPPSPMP